MSNLVVKLEEQAGGITLILPNGDIDSDTSQILKDVLNKALLRKPRSIIVDMSHVPYISSAGLGVFFEAMKKLKEDKAELALCNLRATTRRVFETVKVLRNDQFFPDIEQARQFCAELIERNKQLQL